MKWPLLAVFGRHLRLVRIHHGASLGPGPDDVKDKSHTHCPHGLGARGRVWVNSQSCSFTLAPAATPCHFTVFLGTCTFLTESVPFSTASTKTSSFCRRTGSDTSSSSFPNSLIFLSGSQLLNRGTGVQQCKLSRCSCSCFDLDCEVCGVLTRR